MTPKAKAKAKAKANANAKANAIAAAGAANLRAAMDKMLAYQRLRTRLWEEAQQLRRKAYQYETIRPGKQPDVRAKINAKIRQLRDNALERNARVKSTRVLEQAYARRVRGLTP
jgi:hypothetical protein